MSLVTRLAAALTAAILALVMAPLLGMSVATAVAPSQITMDDPITQYYGSPLAVEVGVSPAAATGTVKLYQGTTLVGSAAVAGGTASVTIPAKALPVGGYTVHADYSGDANYAPSTVYAQLIVAKATPEISATLDKSTVKVVAGKVTASISVTAEGVVPTGTVGFGVVGGRRVQATLVDGEATATLGNLKVAGAQQLQVRYYSDGVVYGDVVSVGTIDVVKQNPRLSVVADNLKAHQPGQRITVEVLADSVVARGHVRIASTALSGEKVRTRWMSDGSETFTVTLGKKGVHQLTVTYLGSQKLNARSRTFSITVR